MEIAIPKPTGLSLCATVSATVSATVTLACLCHYIYTLYNLHHLYLLRLYLLRLYLLRLYLLQFP
jgi:hypothetical protein